MTRIPVPTSTYFRPLYQGSCAANLFLETVFSQLVSSMNRLPSTINRRRGYATFFLAQL